MSAGRAGEVPRRSGERSCDHAADTVLSTQHISRDLAVFIQLLHRNDVLMCSYLEHGIR